MKVEIKTFPELSVHELYELLRLRSEVFVVEQECIYQDIDGKDLKALHVLGHKDDRLIAYARCFAPGDYFKEAAMGRVLVKKEYRNSGCAHEIIKASIEAVGKNFESSKIRISAQDYLIGLYKKHGFRPVGEKYLEDGIPHIAMIR